MEDDRKVLQYVARKIRNVQNIIELDETELEKRIKAINDLFVFMESRKLDSNDIKEQLDELVKSIYYSEMEGLEKEFSETIPLGIGDAIKGDFYGEYAQGKYILINTNVLYEPLKDPDYDTRINGCEKIVHTIAHEIQHHRQYIMATRGVSSKEALMFGKDLAVHDILGKEYYNYNYNDIGTENDANKIAAKKEMEARGYDRKAEIDRLEHEIYYINI